MGDQVMTSQQEYAVLTALASAYAAQMQNPHFSAMAEFARIAFSYGDDIISFDHHTDQHGSRYCEVVCQTSGGCRSSADFEITPSGGVDIHAVALSRCALAIEAMVHGTERLTGQPLVQ